MQLNKTITMLSRRYLRTKTLQALFEYEIGKSVTPAVGEKNLFTSIRNLKNLSLIHLEIILNLKKLALERIENAKTKFLPFEEDLNPNLKFVQNPFFQLLENNLDYQELVKSNKVDVSPEIDIIKQIFQNLINSDEYKAYMNSETIDFEEDKDFIMNVFKDFIVNNDALSSAYAEKNLHWYSDFFEAALLTAKSIKGLTPDYPSNQVLPAFLSDEDDDADDIIFVKTLYHSAIKNKDKYMEIIINRLENWDSDRLAVLDLIILKMALSEFIECPSVPIKVTINEYIELSKDYSTPKSKIFINGLLDKISIELLSKNIIQKTGRGLLT